jgi:PST family polysaccharide transporter
MHPKNKKLIENYSALSILQISNYIFPLVTLPYLVRVLGPEKFGLVSFATAFVMYFNVLTDYGFNIAATRDISLHRNDKNRVSRIFSSVIIIKLGLFFISTIIFALILFSFSIFSKEAIIYIYSYLSVFGSILLPVWFFQGLENTKYMVAITILVKIVWLIAVFTFINSQVDYLLLIVLNSFSHIIIGILCLSVVFFIFKIKFIAPSLAEIKSQLANGWHIFLSSAAITLYTTSNVFILGLFANNEIVGYFSAADKLRTAFQNIYNSATQAIFPHLSNLFKESYSNAIRLVKKFLRFGSFIIFCITILLFIWAPDIISLVLGDQYANSITIFRIIIFLPFIILLSNVFGIQVMINLGYKKEFTRIILIAGLINLILSFIFVPIYLELGTSFILIVTEIFVTAAMFKFLKGNNILFAGSSGGRSRI